MSAWTFANSSLPASRTPPATLPTMETEPCAGNSPASACPPQENCLLRISFEYIYNKLVFSVKKDARSFIGWFQIFFCHAQNIHRLNFPHHLFRAISKRPVTGRY